MAVVAGRSKDNPLVQYLNRQLVKWFQIFAPRATIGTRAAGTPRLQYATIAEYDATVIADERGERQVKRLRIDAAANLALWGSRWQRTRIRIQAQLPPPAVELLVIRAS